MAYSAKSLWQAPSHPWYTPLGNSAMPRFEFVHGLRCIQSSVTYSDNSIMSGSKSSLSRRLMLPPTSTYRPCLAYSDKVRTVRMTSILWLSPTRHCVGMALVLYHTLPIRCQVGVNHCAFTDTFQVSGFVFPKTYLSRVRVPGCRQSQDFCWQSSLCQGCHSLDA